MCLVGLCGLAEDSEGAHFWSPVTDDRSALFLSLESVRAKPAVTRSQSLLFALLCSALLPAFLHPTCRKKRRRASGFCLKLVTLGLLDATWHLGTEGANGWLS